MKDIKYTMYVQEIADLMRGEYLFNSKTALSKMFPHLVEELKSEHSYIKYTLREQIGEVLLKYIKDNPSIVEKLFFVALKDENTYQYLSETLYCLSEEDEAKTDAERIVVLTKVLDHDVWQNLIEMMQTKMEISFVKKETELKKEFISTGAYFLETAETVNDPDISFDIYFQPVKETIFSFLSKEQPTFYQFLSENGVINWVVEQEFLESKTIVFNKNRRIKAF